ncbi:Retrovirus-related Pol polyprotein from transposon gypsy, partial [Mucuna pruriens]
MPGLDRKIMEHKLPLLTDSAPVQQQLRRMRPKVALKIKEEVEKQWNAWFLTVANYPQWVANIVLVPKKDRKVRMCIDYKDLNKASPKDNFPLPHIDYIEDLQKLFVRLRKYKLRMNPAKCTFGIRIGKLLGFVVNERGIEVDPDKVKIIREMPTPKIESKIRGFLGRVNYIARFISQLTATCNPIFKLLCNK